jgi:hypothetical protein
MTIWLLVVICGFGHTAWVWPGATDMILNRPDVEYTSYADCAKDRRLLWANRHAAEKYADVIAARCIPVRVQKEKTKP